ncbi:MAG: archaeal proteasome endopeptidase complex subunit beta [Methanosphaera sp.]|uniref:archaeal proteasome endopeptidase complex subunit beta n=1 Tax=Methanosphaera sp. TaxID=2666342 RepID=UPI0025D1F7EB|nr:archaeal proteasome endopeptidase complex subunit beta [Methanosphaera sp.]MCI5867022.1 archaeal proteasome endopeptidase complex subunit beta [Methanosphaera sp.]MDD6533965.1 archaeal proteasome endopeptidase complex subunit beta [Methanosphaera sp.]MDY3956225.1 archaeal proteasome endopeptidase complex subunit beta [Methanosphaera sp.]
MNQSNENMVGTTTVGLVCQDGVVLATETRATMGALIANKAVNKLYQLDDKVGATIAGTVSHAQTLMDVLQAEIALYKLKNEKDMSMEAIAVLTSNILKSNAYGVQLILTGVDKKGPKLYGLDPSGSYIDDDYTSTGSGSPFAYGVLENKYRKDLTTDEGRLVALEAISAAKQRDVYSGNGFRLATITDEGMKTYTNEEIEELVAQL